jgi:LPS-assembly lipoprotein
MSSLDLEAWLRPARALARRPLGFGVIALSLLLAGCIQPLYGTVGQNGGLGSELQAIVVDPIPDKEAMLKAQASIVTNTNDRLGHYLANDLIFALNGTGSEDHVKKYRLKVSVSEGAQTPLIDTVLGYPTASTVIVTAYYRLEPITGGEPIVKGTAYVAASYDRTSQRFADVRAARDAEIRDARTLADLIRTKLASALAERI